MQEKGSIGQFGRGSQTMFHFTDYPMILSGEFLLILEFVSISKQVSTRMLIAVL